MSKRNGNSTMFSGGINTTATWCLIMVAAGMLALTNTVMGVSALSFAPVAADTESRTAASAGDARREEPKRAEASQRRAASAHPRLHTRRPVTPKLGLGQDNKKKLNSLIAKSLSKKLKRFDSPGEAQEFYLLKRAPIAKDATPSGVKGTLLKRDPIPVERYSNAIEQIKNMPQYSTALNRSFQSENEMGPLAPELAVLGSWTSLGPGNIGGRTRGLVIDPSDASVMYAAGVAGGVWKSTNGGSSWAPLNDPMANLAVCSLVMDPNDSSILYAGTGEGFFNIDGVRGNGIFKSTNSGTSWTQLANTINSNFFFVNDIVVSKGNSQRVYAGTRTGVWRSTDGGTNWTQVHNPGQQGGCTDLAIRTDNLAQDVVLASFGTFVQGTVYRNLDAGAAGVWTSVFSDAGMGRTSLAIAPSNQLTMYALAASITAGTFLDGLQGVFRSTDGGGTWAARVRNTSPSKINTVLLSNPIYAFLTECGFGSRQFYNQGWYDNVIAIDPLDENRVWVGGIDTFRSDDGAANFGIASHWWAGTTAPQYAHADHHAIVFDPGFNGTTNKVMYLGNDGGLFKTTDARAAVGLVASSICNQVTSVPWTNLNNGYAVTQFYDGVMYPDGQTYFGGTQDNGTVRGTTAGGSLWNSILGGDGGYVAVDPTTAGNPATTVLYGEFTGLSIQKSTNGGGSFASSISGISDSGFQFIAPFIMDPGNSARLWTGGFYMWRTTNSAGSWTRAGTITCGNGRVSAIAMAPTDGNKVLSGMSDGCINRTSIGLTSTAATAWHVSTPRNGYVSWLAFDPTDSNIAYATYASFNSVGTDRHVYKSTDSGATWAGLDGAGATGIPDIPVHTVVVDPVSTTTLYIGTDLGVFTTTDGGSTWMKEITGFANVVTESLKIRGEKTLFAFTHGRGAWRVASGPTVAKVKSFTADAFDDGRVLLKWNSGYEVDNLGYNVYREEKGQRVKLTPQMVAGSALMAGQGTALTAGNSYAWSDEPRGSLSSVKYFLEDIDLNGKSAWNGPITIGPSVGKGSAASAQQQATLLTRLGLRQAQLSYGLGSVPAERAAKLAPASLSFSQAGGPAIKLSVNREGWYRVTQQELLAAGLDPKVNPRFLQLFVDGREIPITVQGEQDGRFDPADSVGLYGVGLDTPSSDARVYWLVAGAQSGKRIEEVQGKGSPVASLSFAYTVERKDRTIYFSGLRNGDAENFFGPVIAREPVDQSLTLQRIDKASTSNAQIEVALQGVTQRLHQVKVLLNGADVGSVVFGGQSRGVANLTVTQSKLVDGENVVRLIAQAGETDVSLVDSVRITYQHTYAAESDSLRLTANAGQQVTIDGFTSGDLRVFDVTNHDAVQELATLIKPQKGSWAVTATTTGAGQRTLLALSGARAGQVVSARANQPSSWRQVSNGADLLIIAHHDFKGSLDSLKLLRQSQGLSVAVIDVEDVFDEFSYGNKAPQALKEFVAFAKGNWKKAPRYVLLVGDASLDPKNYLGYGDSDYVPTKLLDTQLMETASDNWLADFNNDGVEGLAIGRLPVRTAQEAAAMINKIVSYDRAAISESVLLVADRNDGYTFDLANSQLRRLIPDGLKVEEIDRGSLDDATAKSRLLEAINRGQKIVNYTGHGSANNWRGQLLTNEDALGLTNANGLSLFITMTCLNGYYQDPVLDGLAESLMKAARGGAVAVWASSGMTMPGYQAVLNQELYRMLFNGSENDSLGEAVMRAKSLTADLDIRRTWILFGDPSMKLK